MCLRLFVDLSLCMFFSLRRRPNGGSNVAPICLSDQGKNNLHFRICFFPSLTIFLQSEIIHSTMEMSDSYLL